MFTGTIPTLFIKIRQRTAMPFFRYRQQILIVSVLFLGSCQSKQDEGRTEKKSQEVAVTPLAAPIETLARRFSPIIRGAWVSANYLAVLEETNSPIAAFDSAGYVSEIHVSPVVPSGDSLVSGVSYGNHEGGDISIYFRPGQRPNSLLTNQREYDHPGSFGEISYQLGSRDTTLTLTTYSRNNKVLRSASYRRIHGTRLDELDALNYAVNKLLFAGSYAGIDSVKRPVAVRFTADGRIIGLNGVMKYRVNTDFGSGPGNDIDHLSTQVNGKHRRLMSYRRSGDTLRLYAASVVKTKSKPGTDDETIDETMTQGKQLFRLIRR